MTKNTTGGKKSKGFARKHLNAQSSSKLRLPQSEHEQIARVSRVLGNGMCYVRTTEGLELLGHIRGKHRGRSKRDNLVVSGSILLVGLREWEDPNYKNCDVLEVYDHADITSLSSCYDMTELADEGAAVAVSDDVLFDSNCDTEPAIELDAEENATGGAAFSEKQIISIDDI